MSDNKVTGLKRIGDLTKNVGPVSHWGADVPLYKLHETPYLFQFDMVVKEFASYTGNTGRYVHIKCAPLHGIGPNGETGDIAVTTGAKGVLARLDAMDVKEFPVLAKFIKGGKAGNEWYDME